jgi:hypothetical protein
MYKIISLLVFVLVGLSAVVHADSVKDSIGEELAFIHTIFATGYAPAQWKAQRFGWNLDTEYNKAVTQVNGLSTVGVAEYRRAIAGLLRSTHDYHVGFSFYSTEAARLPLAVNGVGGHYYIAWIDQDKLNAQAFPFQVGDEIKTFDGRPIADLISDLKTQNAWGVDSTDQKLAERSLTSRAASMGMTVPSGQLILTVERTDDSGATQQISRELTWDYTPETIAWNPSQSGSVSVAAQSLGASNGSLDEVLRPQMAWGMWEAWQSMIDSSSNPYQIGGRKSFVPTLGTKIWESDDDDEFYAYIYRNPAGKLIGYVRIPEYDAKDGKAFVEFKKLIQRFQSTTDALVIDEVNNPGGSVFYVLALTSVLSRDPIKVPTHEIKLWPELVSQNAALVAKLSRVKGDQDTREVMGGEQNDGFPVNYTSGQAALNTARSVMAQWQAGKTITAPLYLDGVDRVNPDPEVNYTKPITVLVNELDFSGGDFFPAIMQDNRRAKIFGARTAGAGGYIINVTYPSSLGLKSFSFTGSIAHRINDQPIENLGITPDIPYQLSVRDLTNNFVDYKKALDAAIMQQLQ